MAIYHLSAQMISRGGGRCATAAVAYRSAERIHDERLGKTFDFTHKGGVEHSEILTPEGAPAWMQDRKKLWNVVEKIEVRKDAQLAREIQVAIPRELSREAGEELVREFAREHFVKHGMVADFSIHRDNPENPHAHITLTTREVTEDGFGKKVREWNSKEWLKGWRESWEHCANRQLAREGHEQRIDHRSHAERGIQLEPTRKIGSSGKNLQNDGRDLVKERMAEQLEIARRNGERILENPNLALECVTYQHTTFTQRDVGRWLNTRTADANQFNACLSKVMTSEELVQVSVDDDGRERFTTKEMINIEKNIRQSTKELLGREGHRVKERFLGQAEATRTLSDEQKNAFRHVAEKTPDIAVIEGYAGTGKSYMLGAAREAWEAQGYRVLGAALAGKAAEGLELSSGIQSRSIHSWEYAWKKGYEHLGSRDVFVIDEAGMVGQRQMNRVMERIREAGAKLVLVGDPQQLQAIEAGSPMRMIAEEVGSETLSEIRRQKEAWQKQATVDLHDGRTESALEAYRQRGFVHEYGTQQEAIDSIVEAWEKHRKEHPKDTQLMLAYKRVDVRYMNERARESRKAGGELKGKGITVETERGEREFDARDRVCFLKNDNHLSVKNGTLGTVEIIEKGQAVIRLDGPEHRRVVVDFERYNHIDHGYAATLHKSQGATADRTHALASKLYDRHTTYVGMTRHVDRVDLHWSREEFSDEKDLHKTLSREKMKQNIVDFQKAIESNEKFAELLEKGPSNLTAEEKKRTRNYAEGDMVRFEKEYKSLGFQKGECAEIDRVDYKYNTVYLRTGEGREVEWHPFKHARVEVFKERELPEKQPEKSVNAEFRDEKKLKETEFNPSAYMKEARDRMMEKEQTASLSDSIGAYDLNKLRMFRERYLQAERDAAKNPTTAKEVIEKFPEVVDAREGIKFHKDQCKEWEYEVRLLKEKHPVMARWMKMGLADDRGLFSAYRNQQKRLREAYNKLHDLLTNKVLQSRAQYLADDHNHSIEVGKTEMRIYRDDFEKGEKLIPEVVVEKYDKMQEIADRPEKNLDDFLREFPEVKDAIANVAGPKWEHKQAKYRLEKFRERHPVRASVGMGKSFDMREDERQTKMALEKAQRALDKTLSDPKLREKARRLSEAWKSDIEHAKEQLDDLKPYYESALDRLDRDQEHGLEKDQSMGLGLGKEDEGTKDQEKSQEHELKIERGFGFDRGMGF